MQSGNDFYWANRFRNETSMAQSITQQFVNEFINEMLNCSQAEKPLRLWEFLNGLTDELPDCQVVAYILNSLMQFDNYNRGSIPICAPTGVGKTIEYTGSGKKSVKLLNISTPSAITAVACGASIIKKGSHATSSALGSADLLEQLGFVVPLTAEAQIDLLSQTGFTFINIEACIPVFNSIYSGYYFKPHILSYALGAFVTSVRATKIVYGLSMPNVEFSASTLGNLTTDDIFIYTSSEVAKFNLDEIAGSGICKVCRSSNGQRTSTEYLLSSSPPIANLVAPPNRAISVKTTIDALRGFGSVEYMDTIALNAAMLLVETDVASNFQTAYESAKAALYSGRSYKKLLDIVICSGGEVSRLIEYSK